MKSNEIQIVKEKEIENIDEDVNENKNENRNKNKDKYKKKHKNKNKNQNKDNEDEKSLKMNEYKHIIDHVNKFFCTRISKDLSFLIDKKKDCIL